MKKIKPILLFIFSFYNLIMFSQEKKFELAYNISGWYKHENGPNPQIEKIYYLNNNVKLGYKIKSPLSFGLSANFNYKLVNSKTIYIVLPDRNYYDIVTSEDFEIGTGPFVKIIFGKYLKIYSILEYNYFFGKGTLTIYNEYHNVSHHTLFKNINHSLIGEIGLGKKVLDNLSLNLFFKEQYIFIFKYRPIDNGGDFKPDTKSYIGLGLIYNCNFKNNTK